MIKPTVAIIRGKFLNTYEMQFFEPLVKRFDITAFGSLTSYHDHFAFPVVKLPSPMDIPEFLYKMPILNRLFIDAHYLVGLEDKLKGYDLVHTAETYFHYTQQCLNAKKKGYVKKVIATVLENIPFNNEGIWGRKAFKERAREELDHIIALTKLTKQTLIKEGTDPKKITVIGHFVDTKRFSPTPEQQKRIKSDSKKLTILYCGRLETEKGVFDLINAAYLLLHDPSLSTYTLTFSIVGSGSKLSGMGKKEKVLGMSTFLKHKNVNYQDMPKVYQDADIYVTPSKPRIAMVRGKSTPTWKEQYNTALLEAQASGLPIVTTKSGGIPENIGDAGILVPEGDSRALAKALKAYILSPKLRRTFAERARKRAVTVHDKSFGAKKLSDLYLSLLS